MNKDVELIKITKDIINEVDSKRFKEYINKNGEKFQQYAFMNNPNRFALMFGKDQVFWSMSNTDLSKIADIEFVVREYFDIVCKEVQDLYNHPNKLYVTSFWLAKQLANSFVHPHFDSGEVNPQFKFSTIIYLNNLEEGGELSFPNLEYTYKPKANEMISFPSQGEQYLHEVKQIGGDRYSLVYWLTEDPYFAI